MALCRKHIFTSQLFKGLLQTLNILEYRAGKLEQDEFPPADGQPDAGRRGKAKPNSSEGEADEA